MVRLVAIKIAFGAWTSGAGMGLRQEYGADMGVDQVASVRYGITVQTICSDVGGTNEWVLGRIVHFK